MTTQNRDELGAKTLNIQQAVVSIQALKVGKKQMTQAVLKQLQEDDLIDDVEMCLDGNLWGWVNYSWGDIDKSSKCFIFERDGILYRSSILIRKSHEFCLNYNFMKDWPSRSDVGNTVKIPWGLNDVLENASNVAYCLRCREILDGWRPKSDVSIIQRNWRSNLWNVYYPIKNTNIKLSVHFDIPDKNIPFLDYLAPQSMKSHEYSLRDSGQEISRAIEWMEHHIELFFGELVEKKVIELTLMNKMEEVREFLKGWDVLMDQLQKSDQLFIAV